LHLVEVEESLETAVTGSGADSGKLLVGVKLALNHDTSRGRSGGRAGLE